MTHKGTVTLQEIDESNMGEVSALQCSAEQCEFTNSPTWALLQTGFGYRKDIRRTYAVCQNGTVVGMLTIETFDNEYRLTDMLINISEQRKGISAEAVALALEKCKTEHRHGKVAVHISPENIVSQKLAEKCEFVAMGISDVGYGVYSVYEYAL
jgi:RimJ/RimL family protein N-acetyltransferase